MCSVCDRHGEVDDEENGIVWFGCDACDHWYHDCSFSVSEAYYERLSLEEGMGWGCKVCMPNAYEE